jgi:hypothetical protein
MRSHSSAALSRAAPAAAWGCRAIAVVPMPLSSVRLVLLLSFVLQFERGGVVPSAQSEPELIPSAAVLCGSLRSVAVLEERR